MGSSDRGDEYGSETQQSWVFECTECGKQWVDPVSPVTGHFCDRDPWAEGIPEGEPADVEVIQSP